MSSNRIIFRQLPIPTTKIDLVWKFFDWLEGYNSQLTVPAKTIQRALKSVGRSELEVPAFIFSFAYPLPLLFSSHYSWERRTKNPNLTRMASNSVANLEDVPSVDLMTELLRRMKCSTKPDKRLILIGNLFILYHLHFSLQIRFYFCNFYVEFSIFYYVCYYRTGAFVRGTKSFSFCDNHLCNWNLKCLCWSRNFEFWRC